MQNPAHGTAPAATAAANESQGRRADSPVFIAENPLAVNRLSQPPAASGFVATPEPSHSARQSSAAAEYLRMKYPKLSRHLLENEPSKGGLDEDEVQAALRDIVKAEARNKRMKWILVALCVLVFLLVGATVGVSVAAALLAKDTTVQNGALTDKNTGNLVATGPSYGRGLPATAAVEQTVQTEKAARRHLLASGGSSSSLPQQDLSGLSPRYRQLLQTASAYPWINPRSNLESSPYVIDPAWYSTWGVSSYVTVLVVGSDTTQEKINTLTASNDYWCPSVTDVLVSPNTREGFFLGLFYCDIVLQAESVKSPPPRSFSCSCRTYVARTQCPETGDPNNPIDLSCPIDVTWKKVYNAGADCTVKTYSCPDNSTDLAYWMALGTQRFGSPGWEMTSGASVFSQAVSTTLDQTQVSRKLLASVAQEPQGDIAVENANGRLLKQWDTSPTSIVLVMTTSNTQSTSGSAGWGR